MFSIGEVVHVVGAKSFSDLEFTMQIQGIGNLELAMLWEAGFLEKWYGSCDRRAVSRQGLREKRFYLGVVLGESDHFSVGERVSLCTTDLDYERSSRQIQEPEPDQVIASIHWCVEDLYEVLRSVGIPDTQENLQILLDSGLAGQLEGDSIEEGWRLLERYIEAWRGKLR